MKPVPSGVEPQPFVEIFPIRQDALPPLTAYATVMKEDGKGDGKSGGKGANRGETGLGRQGHKLAYRLRAILGGKWVWAGSHMVTDAAPDAGTLAAALDKVRAAVPRFAALLSLERIPGWQPDAGEIADLIVRGWVEPQQDAIDAAMGRMTFQLKHMTVEREAVVRAWVIEQEGRQQPAISISVYTRLLYTKEGLNEYAASLAKPSDLVGVQVADRTSSMQGEIIKVVGRLADHRARLIGLTQRPPMRDRLQAADDSELVVKVSSNGNEYDYIASTLQSLVTMDTASRFDVIGAQVDKALHLKPAIRAQLVKTASDILKQAGLIDAAYNASNASALFDRRSGRQEIVLADKRTAEYDPALTPATLAKFGLHTLHPTLRESKIVRIAVLNALAETGDDFLQAFNRTVEREFGFKLEVAKERKLRVATPANLETGVRDLVKNTLSTGAASLLLVFLPDEPDSPDPDETIDARYTRLQTVGRGQPCLVIHESTMNKPEAMHALVVGVLARGGSLPYLLDAPLPYCDRVVGLHFGRETKRDGEVITGIARIFRSDGLLLRAITAQETIPLANAGDVPERLIERLLPSPFLQKRRALLHIDGRVTRPMMRALGGWEAELDATFLPVEVRSAGVPRLYTLHARNIESPAYGTMFRVGEHEAMLVTSAAPYDGTPQPLHLRVDDPLTVEQAADSIIAFSALHYGALRRPKYPLTLHSMDMIASSIARGVHPPDSEAASIYWL